MPTTPNGTVYTTRTFTNSLGEQSVYAVADEFAAAVGLTLMVYMHGADGPYNQFTTATEWAATRNWLIDNGFAYVEGAGGGLQPWGNPLSEASYLATIAYVDTKLSVARIAILARSMGGIVGARIFTTPNVFQSRLVGLLVNSGVQDLVWAYDSGSWTAAMNSAWAVSNRAAFVAAVAGFNPIDGPAALWDGKRVLQLVGDADTLVPAASNGLAMAAMYAGHPALELVDIKPGGDHSASGGSYTRVSQMTSFLSTLAQAPIDSGGAAVSTFYANLSDLGLDPRAGMVPELTFTITRAGVSPDGHIVAGSTKVRPNESGNFVVDLASTINLSPAGIRVKITGGWLGEDSYFELPEFEVPDEGMNLGELMRAAVGSDDVHVSTTALDPGVYSGFQLNTVTGDLYQRRG